jgi:hypothetical protein
MRVTIDKCYLERVIEKPEDLKKISGIPSADDIILICAKKMIYNSSSFIGHLPDAWLSDDLFYKFVDKTHGEDTVNVVKRFVEAGKLPAISENEKIRLAGATRKTIRFFPELKYDVWLKHADGIDHSDQVPVAYRTQDMLLAIMAEGATITEDLMNDGLVDAYITKYESLNCVPKAYITLERLKRVLKKVPEEKITKEMMSGIKVDEELADLLTGCISNFKFIPDQYQTRARVITFIANEVKRDYRCSFYNTGVPQLIKRNKWLGAKFYLEVLEKTGDAGVRAIINIHNELKPNYSTPSTLDMAGLVKTYPGAIKYVGKSDQTRAMADAVLASGRAVELKDFLSLKFITKQTSPLFLSSDNEEIKSKVERILTGAPKRPIIPSYTIEPGREIEFDLTAEDVDRLRQCNIPFIS